MANFLEFVKKHLTKVVVIGVGGVCLIVAGAVVLADSIAYANYEAQYDKEAEEAAATFPQMPKGVIMDNDYVVYNQEGDGITSTKSAYKNAYIYYARDAAIAPLSETVSAEYAKTDDSMLGEYITGLDRRGGAITFTVPTANYGRCDVAIAMKTNWVDEHGTYHELENVTDYIKIQNNGLEIKTENIKLEVSDSWSQLILKDAFLLKGQNTFTITTSAYNDFGNKDNVLYIMPNIRNLTVLTNVNVYTPEFDFDLTGFKTDYRLIEIPDLSTIKVVRRIGDPSDPISEEETTADQFISSIDYDAGKIVVKCSSKVSKEIPVTFDKSAEKNTVSGEINGKAITVVVTNKDQANITVDGASCVAKIELVGKKGYATIKIVEKISGDDTAYASLPKSLGIEEKDNNLALASVKYYQSTQKANTSGSSQTGNTYFAINSEDFLTVFWNWTYNSGDRVAIFKCSYTFNEAAMSITITADLANNGVEQWQYVNNKTFTVTSISVGEIPESIMSRVTLYE